MNMELTSEIQEQLVRAEYEEKQGGVSIADL